MIINQLGNSRHFSEANKWLKVLKEKAYLDLEKNEKEAVKKIYIRLSEEVKNYQSPNTSLLS